MDYGMRFFVENVMVKVMGKDGVGFLRILIIKILVGSF